MKNLDGLAPRFLLLRLEGGLRFASLAPPPRGPPGFRLPDGKRIKPEPLATRSKLFPGMGSLERGEAPHRTNSLPERSEGNQK